MPQITFVAFDGEKFLIEAESGLSLMENALNHSVPGIDADCGGACSCGTCHCFVLEQWQTISGHASEEENGMLEMRPDRAPNSRLSCQINVTEALDGMVVNLPEFQM